MQHEKLNIWFLYPMKFPMNYSKQYNLKQINLEYRLWQYSRNLILQIQNSLNDLCFND